MTRIEIRPKRKLAGRYRALVEAERTILDDVLALTRDLIGAHDLGVTFVWEVDDAPSPSPVPYPIPPGASQALAEFLSALSADAEEAFKLSEHRRRA